MSQASRNTERRILELLADRAIFGLPADEEQELDRLQQMLPGFDFQCMERAAATAQLAFTQVEPLPAAIRARVLESAAPYVQEPPP